MKRLFSLIIIAMLLVTSFVPFAYGGEEEKEIEADDSRIQILFTHDLHSHLDPFNLNGEMTGGFARLKTLIANKRYEAETEGIATLLVDAGDFSMGTLYQTINEVKAPELTLLGYLGYDATIFGNHEFDYRSIGTSNMFRAALENESTLAPSEVAKGMTEGVRLPEFLVSNIDWELNNSEDNMLVKKALDDYGAKEYIILEKNGIRIGLFGLVGADAEDCAPDSGIDFSDIVESSKSVVTKLQAEGVDLIVALSHSGVMEVEDKSEDEILAKAVPEIDVIISGHTHTKLDEPIIYGNTHIASANEYGKYLGEIDLVKNEEGRWTLENYKHIPVNAEIEEDAEIKALIENYKGMINDHYLAQFGYEYDTVLAVNDFGFTPFDKFGKVHEEDTLGSIISDSYIYAVKQAEGENYEKVYATVAMAGTIRDSLPKGEITVWDAFNVQSLGIGPDRIVGYPIVSVYVTGAELKLLAEVDASVTSIMDEAQLYPSGIRWEYNPNRFFLNKITHVEFVDENGEPYPLEDDKLYRCVCGLFSAQMLGWVKDLSYGLIQIAPKDAEGNPITNYEEHIIYDSDGNEVKEWYALASYLDSFPENEDGVSVVPDDYAAPEGRKLAVDDDSFGAIIKAPGKIMKMVYGIIAAVAIVIVLIISGIVCIIKRRKKSKGRA